jgi:threonine dehydratase
MQLQDIEEARARISEQIEHTPCVRSATLSAMTGADIYLKFENLQFTASFKERGALNCLLQLTSEQKQNGVIAMSAGNHAQAVAYHCKRLGIPACIVMPRYTPDAKVEQTRVHDAEIILHGRVFDETLTFTQALAKERKMTLVHPFDDVRVIAGQGTVGLEIMEQIPDVEMIVVPVGGGGLIGGVSTAAKSVRPEVVVIGVQMQRFPSTYDAFYQHTTPAQPEATVAEGIAVKTPGAHTLPLIKQHVDEVLLVSEEQVEQAVFTLLEIEKTVAEGAGAAGLAAVVAEPARFAGRRVALIISGGNIDMMTLSAVVQRGLVRSHRLVRLTVEIPDVPGALGELTQVLGELHSNIVDIVHQRAFGASSVKTIQVELVLQMRGEEQVDRVVAELVGRGYHTTQ